MSGALYTTEILRLATSIPHLGTLEAPNARVERRAPICGSRVAVDLCIDSHGRVSQFAQTVKACALGQASAALLGAEIMGKSADELALTASALADFLSSKRADPGNWAGLTLFAAARPHSARHASILLPFQAAAEAVAQAISARNTLMAAQG